MKTAPLKDFKKKALSCEQLFFNHDDAYGIYDALASSQHEDFDM